MKITSYIIKRAHLMTRKAVLNNSEIDYRTQLGIFLKYIMTSPREQKLAELNELAMTCKDLVHGKRVNELLEINEIMSCVAAIENKYNIDFYEDMKRYSKVTIELIANEAYGTIGGFDKRFRLSC